MTTPQDTPQAIADAIQVAIRLNDDQALTNRQVDAIAAAVVTELTAAGYRIIRTDAAEHGDQLVQVGWRSHSGGIHDLGNGPIGLDRPVFVARRVVGNEQDTPQHSSTATPEQVFAYDNFDDEG